MKLLEKIIHKTDAVHSDDWNYKVQKNHPQKRIVHGNKTTAYSRQELAESVHSVCYKVFGYSGEAETTALRVCLDVEDWLKNKQEVTKADIKRRAGVALRNYNPLAAYEYAPINKYKVTRDEYGAVRL